HGLFGRAGGLHRRRGQIDGGSPAFPDPGRDIDRGPRVPARSGDVTGSLRRALAAAAILLLVSCTSGSGDAGRNGTPSGKATPNPSPSDPRYGGADVAWPIRSRNTPVPS